MNQKRFDLITPNTKFTVKIIDLGLTRVVGVDTATSNNGNLKFSSPEKAKDALFYQNSDLFSLAAMILYCFSPKDLDSDPLFYKMKESKLGRLVDDVFNSQDQIDTLFNLVLK